MYGCHAFIFNVIICLEVTRNTVSGNHVGQVNYIIIYLINIITIFNKKKKTDRGRKST